MFLCRKPKPKSNAETNTANTAVQRKVSRAYLIKGGTEESRNEKCDQLEQGDGFYMRSHYSEGDELAVIFSANHSDFKGMTFQEAKKIAGKTILTPDLETSTFGKEPRFGIIDVTALKKTYTFGR
jgi:hypothetical protein